MENGQFQKFSPRKRVENRTISRIRALNIGNNKARDLSSEGHNSNRISKKANTTFENINIHEVDAYIKNMELNTRATSKLAPSSGH